VEFGSDDADCAGGAGHEGNSGRDEATSQKRVRNGCAIGSRVAL
jgi:hypothetical protein